VDRRKKSRANRGQLRCCNWIRLPIGPILENFEGEGGKKVIPAMPEQTQEPEYLSGPPHSTVAAPLCRGVSQHGDTAPWLQTEKTSSQKEE
jgi:hypothetical protein